MKKFGTHGDCADICIGDTVTTPSGKKGIVSNIVIGTTTRYVVTFPDETSNVLDRFDLTRDGQ